MDLRVACGVPEADLAESYGAYVMYASSAADFLPMRLRNKTAQLFAR
jgi:hypothetical protein